MQDMIKILIVDRHAVVSNGISTVLRTYADFEVLGRAADRKEVLQFLEQGTPDIIIIDLDLPGPISSIELLRMLRKKLPRTRVVVLTNLLEEQVVRNALQVGVTSYLLKDTSLEELARAIRAAHQGVPTLSPEVTRLVVRELSNPLQNGRDLTSREREVLKLIARGLNNQEIAKELNISLSTVQFHVSNILDKLEVHNRIEATAFAVRHRLAD
jgi:NarL family two-component system response regulator LiaR